MDHALSNWRPSARASKAVHSALTRARSIEVALPKFTVVADDAGQPFFTSASEQLGGPEGLSGYLLTVGGTPLRRVAAVLWTPEAVAAREAAPTHVLKIARHRSMRPDTQTEEFALALLRGIGHIDSTAPASGPPGGVALPRILGAGEFDEHQVSLETAVAGSPLRDALMADPLGAARARDRVVRWLTGVASATRAPLDLAPVESALPLWGASAATIAEAIRLARVSGVSGALAHGDLLDGGNILVEGSSVAVIDWAAAKAGAPPLTDVLPFLLRSLCLEEAGTEEMASTVEAAIRIATGQSPRSRILFGAVAELCSALGIPDNARGPLATCVWAYAGSLQFVADRERALQGVEVRHEVLWPEAVARAWFDAPGLGLAWGAFPR